MRSPSTLLRACPSMSPMSRAYPGSSLAIAVIPESLIAILTITMATGTSRMARAHVVVRQLNALEGVFHCYSTLRVSLTLDVALGSVTDVCSDRQALSLQARWSSASSGFHHSHTIQSLAITLSRTLGMLLSLLEMYILTMVRMTRRELCLT